MNSIETKDTSGKMPLTYSFVLAMGIISAALSSYGIPGIILGIITQKKVKQYLEENNYVNCTHVMIGSILSKVGFYAGIAYTLFWFAYVAYFALVFGYYGMLISLFGEMTSSYLCLVL